VTDGISMARQRLRDYAREQVPDTILHVRRTDDVEGVPSTQQLQVAVGLGTRGEAAGKTFVAVQAALSVVEELRVIRLPDELSPDEAFGWRQCRDDAADRIEAAVLKALS
jgi:hypothetical protein